MHLLPIRNIYHESITLGNGTVLSAGIIVCKVDPRHRVPSVDWLLALINSYRRD